MVCVTIGMARISTLTTQWLCVPCLCKHLKPFTCNGGTKNHNSTNKTAIVTFVVEDPYPSENYDNSILRIIVLPLASVSMSIRDLFPCVCALLKSSNITLICLHVPVHFFKVL